MRPPPSFARLVHVACRASAPDAPATPLENASGLESCPARSHARTNLSPYVFMFTAMRSREEGDLLLQRAAGQPRQQVRLQETGLCVSRVSTASALRCWLAVIITASMACPRTLLNHCFHFLVLLQALATLKQMSLTRIYDAQFTGGPSASASASASAVSSQTVSTATGASAASGSGALPGAGSSSVGAGSRIS